VSEGTVILAVDDSFESLSLLVELLTPAGYQVRAADSGELGLAAVAVGPPDLILLGLHMKGMGGIEVCRRLKSVEETRDIPIILLSASMDAKERVAGLQLGASDFITEPFQPEALLARVRTHLSLHRASASLARQTAVFRDANLKLQAEVAERQRAEKDLGLSLEEAERARRALLGALEDQERAAKALRASEERLRDITSSVGDWVWEVNEDGVYTYSSEKSRDVLGRAPEEIVGKRPFDFMPPDEAARVGAVFTELVAAKAPIRDLETWNLRKGG